MREGLVNGDIDRALKFFHEGSKEKYGTIFQLVGSELPNIATNMREIQLVYIHEDVAKYRIRRDQEVRGILQAITYYIYFVRDGNGLWKIESF